MLSTKDNPFNPFTDFESWRRFDISSGNRCCEILARCAFTSSDISEDNNDIETENAIDSIIANDPLGKFIKIVDDSLNDTESALPNEPV